MRVNRGLFLKLLSAVAVLLVSLPASAIIPINCGGGVFVNPPATCPATSSSSKKDSAVTSPGVIQSTTGGLVIDLGGVIAGGGGAGGGGATSGFVGAQNGYGGNLSRFALVPPNTGAAAAAGKPVWNVWGAFTQADVGYGFQPLQAGGSVNVAVGGIDYAIRDGLTVGIAVTDERARISTPFNGGNLSVKGNTVAPYLGWSISPNWKFDASIGLGRSQIDSVDASAGGRITGSTRDNRVLVNAGLANNRIVGNWLLTARGGVSSSEDKFSAFTLSDNTFVASSVARTTQVRLGGQAMYNGGAVLPFMGLTYVNDIQRPNQAAVGGQNAANDRDGWQLRAGLNIPSRGALYGSVSLSSEMGRSQVKNDQILVNLGARF